MRWLHISDLHVDAEGSTTNVDALMNRFLENLKVQISENPVDCIIFTGDLFNRGKWKPKQIESIEKNLIRIYETCSESGKWGWNRTQPMRRIYYCPGNHDVLREAYYICDNSVLHRKDILTHPEHVSNSGYFTATGNEYTLLTEETFGQFYSAMEKMCGNDSYISDNKYEYRIFTPDADKGNFRFIGINTALLAAQDFDKDSIETALQTTFSEFINYHTILDTKKALAAYRKYDSAINEKLGKIKNDQNKLCFVSENATERIKNPQESTISILFGHHPISFLSPDAADRLNIIAETTPIHLYLCGHMHKPHGEKVVASYQDCLGSLNKDAPLYQVTVGGLFSDKSGYNEISYSIGEIENKNQYLSLTVSVFVFAKDIFGELRWHDTKKVTTLQFKQPTYGSNVAQNAAKGNQQQTDPHRNSDNTQKSSTDPKGKETDDLVAINQNDKDFRSSMQSLVSRKSYDSIEKNTTEMEANLNEQ